MGTITNKFVLGEVEYKDEEREGKSQRVEINNS